MKNFRLKLIPLTAVSAYFLLTAFSARIEPAGDDEEGFRSLLSPEAYDSLIAVWYERNIGLTYQQFVDEFINIDPSVNLTSSVPDSVYAARMKMIVSPIPMGFNDIIKRHVVLYSESRKALMGRMLGLAQLYFPMIEEELDRHGLPHELKILPIIESALNPKAVSRAGATGLWQFMLATGKSYGLEVTSFVDQRMDPVLATRAACRFLGDLYRMYNDWTLAIAAYNCGPGNVNKALKRAGANATTFWDIYPYLPNETRGYLPAFIGATYAYTFHKHHNIEMVSPPLPLSTDTITIPRLMHFEQISSTIDLPIETLRALNPQYKLDIVPSIEEKKYPVTLPQTHVAQFLQYQEDIMAKDTVYLAQYLKDPAAAVTAQATSTSGSRTYRVKSGDTLGAIARKHGVTVAQLMRWNNIKDAHKLRIGQVLQIN